MPLISPAVIDPEDPGPEIPPPIEIPKVGYASITYVDPTGTRWPMTDLAGDWYALAEGVSGLGAAPVSLVTDPHPRGGERLRHGQPLARTIIWPMLVKGSDHGEFTKTWRALATAFTRTLREGPGWLEVVRPDGSGRRIAVHYQGGWDGLGQPATGITWDKAVLTLWCEDPYWVDLQAQTVHREQGAGADFLQPYPTVSSSQVLGATTLVQPGDVEVWPTWTVTGPATSITFSATKRVRGPAGLRTAVEAFTLDMTATVHGALLAGETVTISTDPPRVRSGTDETLTNGLNWPGAVLWSIPPGSTPVTFQLAGAQPGSAVDLSYYPRYETA
ncbi:phage tail family protein [Streptomyces sp. SHP 1-2]|uniref:phage tail family protein n=1 Tax=Streptomyces sp. SHP 1-2 TaxID=2769489 RepID=UPI002237C021|nr:phage tail family protein [Streptomyces sp. SHP 1-2]MCW5252209.1 phage tail protein [Streptomyces sp. SHP 1-2]